MAWLLHTNSSFSCSVTLKSKWNMRVINSFTLIHPVNTGPGIFKKIDDKCKYKTVKLLSLFWPIIDKVCLHGDICLHCYDWFYCFSFFLVHLWPVPLASPLELLWAQSLPPLPPSLAPPHLLALEPVSLVRNRLEDSLSTHPLQVKHTNPNPFANGSCA